MILELKRCTNQIASNLDTQLKDNSQTQENFQNTARVVNGWLTARSSSNPTPLATRGCALGPLIPALPNSCNGFNIKMLFKVLVCEDFGD